MAMRLAEEIFDEMRSGRSAIFVVGLAALSNRDADKVIAALREALEMYRRSNYHELGPAATAAANLSSSTRKNR
jgi:hypothetical protein